MLPRPPLAPIRAELARSRPALATRRWSSKRMRIRSGLFCGSSYWVLLVSGRVSVPKPLSQIQRSTRWLLQGLSPRPSFGGFGLKATLGVVVPEWRGRDHRRDADAPPPRLHRPARVRRRPPDLLPRLERPLEPRPSTSQGRGRVLWPAWGGPGAGLGVRSTPVRGILAAGAQTPGRRPP